MDQTIDNSRGEAGGSATPHAGPSAPAQRGAKPRKKKQKEGAGKGVHRQRTIPKPYLAVAPAAVSGLSANGLHELSTSSLTNLILPSSFPRPTRASTSLGVIHPPVQPRPTSRTGNANAPTNSNANTGAPKTPTKKPRKYASGLLAPPLIMPGGVSATPRVQSGPSRQRQGPANDGWGMDIRRNRSRERLREISGGHNASMLSLGHIGRILDSDPTTAQVSTAAQPARTTTPVAAPAGQTAVAAADHGPVPEQVTTPRRRRRVVRDNDGNELRRRLTVTSREEGRAMGLARGASMRRLNVWDDVPGDSADPPPAFPFPTSANNPLPPTFDTSQASSAGSSTGEAANNERPRSPPPSFEQAIGLLPLPLPPVTEANEEEEPRRGSASSLPANETAEQGLAPPEPNQNASDADSTSTHYTLAPQSPTGTLASLPGDDADEDESRQDRIAWNADILAGYTLEERVRREMTRRQSSLDAKNESNALRKTVSTGNILDTATSARQMEDVGAVQQPDHTPTRSQPPLRLETSVFALSKNNEQDPSSPQSSTTARNSTGTVKAGAGSRQSPGPSRVNSLSSRRGSLRRSSAERSPVSPLAPFTPASPTMATAGATAQTSSPVDVTGENDALARRASEPANSGVPERRLSRGNAIRRSSSGLVSDTSATQRRRFTEDHRRPLFSSTGYTATQVRTRPEPQMEILYRSADGAAPRTGPYHRGASLRSRIRSQPNLLKTNEEHKESENGLPPHREAALRRRELGLPKISEVSAPIEQIHAKAPSRQMTSSGPLIDFTTASSALPPTSHSHYRTENTAWTNELLQLLDEVQAPRAESSAQGAARLAAAKTAKEEVAAALEATLREEEIERAKNARILESIMPRPPSPEEHDNNDTSHDERAGIERKGSKKRPPAPPPPTSLRYKKQQQAQDKSAAGVVRRRSVLATATSPIIPFTVTPNARSTHSPPSPTAHLQAKPTSGPTRRPPPPPPIALQPLAPPAGGEEEGSGASSPDSPPPFQRRPPLHAASNSSYSYIESDTSDSIVSTPEPKRMIARRPYTSLASRPGIPKGPRPPPPPRSKRKRTWANVVAEKSESASPAEHRPPTEVTDIRPDEPVSPPNATQAPEAITEEDRSPVETRSRSVQEARPPARQRSIEYTDLDLLVHRMERTGREYEGFSQITSFLGPAKSTAATPGQISTLLLAPVLVDSKRTTPQGKVKLKLSLLGVRVTKCPICLSQFKDKDKAVLLPECSHVAHQQCATRWFRDENRCFVCRVALKEG